jgi:hypothetical protein
MAGIEVLNPRKFREFEVYQGSRLEGLKNAMLNASQNNQQDVANKKHDFQPLNHEEFFRKVIVFACKDIPRCKLIIPNIQQLASSSQVGISLI